MSTGRAKRGVTLIEQIICCALVSLLLTVIYEMLAASKRYQDNCEAKIKIQAEVLRSMSFLTRELNESDRFAINADPGGNTLVFPTPRDTDNRIHFDPEGRLLWQRFVCYDREDVAGVSCLVRRSLNLASPSPDVPAPMMPAVLTGDASLDVRVMARHIKEFRPQLTPDGTVEFTVLGKIQFLIHSYGVEMTQKVLPVN